jgi:hypothetical protein
MPISFEQNRLTNRQKKAPLEAARSIGDNKNKELKRVG